MPEPRRSVSPRIIIAAIAAFDIYDAPGTNAVTVLPVRQGGRRNAAAFIRC
jgi:hypothetical protein